MTRLGRWTYAAKPKSWPKLLVPLALGQTIGLAGAGSFDGFAFASGLAFVVFDALFIVFLNDWADRDIDTLKRRRFPNGSSPKTIPDKILPAHHLLIAGLLSGALALAIAFTAAHVLDRPWLGPLAALCLGIFVAYTLPPIKLNYRGGGELLEMLGVGVALPCLEAYWQAGRLFDLAGLSLLPGFAFLCLASAIASGLADERSDRHGGKRTVVVLVGNRIARRSIEASVLVGGLIWLGSPAVFAAVPVWLTTPPAILVFWYAGAVISSSRGATTTAPNGLSVYKRALHHAVWRGGLCASMLLLCWHFLTRA